MKCPHCLDSFHDNPNEHDFGEDQDGTMHVVQLHCPSCKRFVIFIRRYRNELRRGRQIMVPVDRLVHPKSGTRPPPPKDVPPDCADDFREACLVLSDSAKASAALTRRCLQHVLREKAGVKKGDLGGEIQQVIDSGKIPSHLAESLDAVRHIGNFAAHPIKSNSSGEVVDVEPGEAEWNLDVLEALFDFYFVQPALLQRKRAALNAKLADAGKPPMK